MTARSSGPNLGYEAQLFAAADLLRSDLEPAHYKHLVLSLLYLRVADADGFRALAATPADELAARLKAAETRLGGLGTAFDRLAPDRLAALVAWCDTIPTATGPAAPSPGIPRADTLGRIYEYFLGRFASAEGRGGGEFYTPAALVRLLVALLEPTEGVVYDPCCGSGGMFVQSALSARDGLRFVGQESNPTTWQLARMNLRVHDLTGDLGDHPGDTLANDLHPGLRAETILANPPFNISRWHRDPDDPRWRYGVPPASNANYAWLQHILAHLAPGGRAAVILSNGSLSVKQRASRAIRRAMLEAGVVEAIITCPPNLFYGTTIPCCVWILRPEQDAANKSTAPTTLVIDAQQLGHLTSRVHRTLSDAEITTLASIYRQWRQAGTVSAENAAAVDRTQLADADWNLVPGRYLTRRVERPTETGPTLRALSTRLAELRAEGAALDDTIAVLLEQIDGAPDPEPEAG